MCAKGYGQNEGVLHNWEKQQHVVLRVGNLGGVVCLRYVSRQACHSKGFWPIECQFRVQNSVKKTAKMAGMTDFPTWNIQSREEDNSKRRVQNEAAWICDWLEDDTRLWVCRCCRI